MHAPNKILLSIDDVVQATSLGRTTIFSLLKQGDLRSVRVGKRTFVRPSDLDDFVESRAQRTALAN